MRKRAAWRALLLALAASAGSPSAQAGAFLEPPGEGIAIVGGAFSGAIAAYDRLGRLVPIAPWKKFELTTFAEYGITDWLTVVASPSVLAFRQSAPWPNTATAGVAEVGARVKLLEWEGSVLSGQTVLRAPLSGAAARPFEDTSRFVQVDARVAWGHGFELFGFRAFTDLQIGFRSSGNFGHEARIDGTLGVWAFEPLLLLFQTFTAVTPGRIGTALYLSQKSAISGVYWITPKIGLQLGGVYGSRGINTGAERGAFSAVWVKF